MIRHIVAFDQVRGIAKRGVQPWFIPEDEQYFVNKTKTHGGNILVGSTTFKLFKHPLSERRNFVVTRHAEPISGAEVVNDLEAFLESFTDDLWIIGGTEIFEQTLAMADELYVTAIAANFGCDKFYPQTDHEFELISKTDIHEQNGFRFRYEIYARTTAQG